MGLKNYIPPVLWIGIIFILSMDMFGSSLTYRIIDHSFHLFRFSLNYRELDDVDFTVRKTAHFLVYATLAALWFRAFRKSGVSIPAAFGLSLMISLSCGALDEFHQSFEPDRTSKASDIFIDGSGAAAGLLFCALKIKHCAVTAARPGA